MDDFITPNLVKQAEELFNLYPEYALDMELALKECPKMIEKYNRILCSIAGALIYENEARFEKAKSDYINSYNKLKGLGLCHEA